MVTKMDSIANKRGHIEYVLSEEDFEAYPTQQPRDARQLCQQLCQRNVDYRIGE